MPHRTLLAAGAIAFALGSFTAGAQAAPGWEGRVPDVCDGAPAGHDACAMWISSLWSEYGRCCDLADAIDVLWQSSRTAESGYAVYYDGQWYDVDGKAAHMQLSGGDGS